jgi:hypothetical protein
MPGPYYANTTQKRKRYFSVKALREVKLNGLRLSRCVKVLGLWRTGLCFVRTGEP